MARPKNVSKRLVENHGNERWRVDFGRVMVDGQMRRRVQFFGTEAEADKAITGARKDQVAIGKRWASMPASERVEIIELLRDMESAGCSLRKVWESYRAEKLMPVAEEKRRSLDKAIAELLTTKRASNCRERYITSLEQYLKQFARDRGTMPVHRITARDIELWFDGRSESLSSRSSNLGRISSLFEMCWRRGYIAENPCSRVERVKLDTKAPNIFTLKQVARCLVGCRRRVPNMLGWLSLSLLAGLRPEEAQRMKWSRIDLKRKLCHVDEHTTKVRFRRIVHLTPAAIGWLTLAKALHAPLPITLISRKRYIVKLRQVMRLDKWPQDITRHTAASHLVARSSSYSEVATSLGTSEGELRTHYVDLVEKAEGEKFASMVPTRRMLLLSQKVGKN